MDRISPVETERTRRAADSFPREEATPQGAGEPASQGHPAATPPLEGSGSNAHICSTHPQIHRRDPGVCPICHVPLKPVSDSAPRQEGERADLRLNPKAL